MSRSTLPLRRATRAGVPLVAAFDGVRLTSDGGLPWLAGTDAARVQFDTLWLRLLKIGGRVWERVGWVRVALAASHPAEPLWQHLAALRRRS